MRLSRAVLAVLVALALVGMLAAGLVLTGTRTEPVATGAPPPPSSGVENAHVDHAAAVPRRAWDVLAEIRQRNGEPPPDHAGGRTFQNRERRLPSGVYREYDVEPRRPGRPRGAERIVIEQRSGRAYYTGDHYVTFVPMAEPPRARP
jgi:guanyl-specific ribonuclease Sa